MIIFECAVESEIDTFCSVFELKNIYWKWDKRGWDGGQECGVAFRPECGASVPSALFSCFLMISCCWRPDWGLRPMERQTLLTELRGDPLPRTSCERFTAPMMETPPFTARASQLPEEGCLRNCRGSFLRFFSSARDGGFDYIIFATLIKISKWWR